MTIEQTNVVDAIGIDQRSNAVILTVSDHLDWQRETEKAHLRSLQEKLNTYLSFIESGEIFTSYPDARGRAIQINVVAKYPLSTAGKDFYDRASPIVQEARIKLSFQLLVRSETP